MGKESAETGGTKQRQVKTKPQADIFIFYPESSRNLSFLLPKDKLILSYL
jgi:hypothetical protein